MTTYYARILDAVTGSEEGYDFDAKANLMQCTAMKSSGVFFNDVDHEIFDDHVGWELNAVMNNRERRVVTANGSLFPKKNEPPIPFLLIMSGHNNGSDDRRADQKQTDPLP